MPLGLLYGEPCHQVGAALIDPRAYRRLAPNYIVLVLYIKPWRAQQGDLSDNDFKRIHQALQNGLMFGVNLIFR